jgi:hypothetical protein
MCIHMYIHIYTHACIYIHKCIYVYGGNQNCKINKKAKDHFLVKYSFVVWHDTDHSSIFALLIPTSPPQLNKNEIVVFQYLQRNLHLLHEKLSEKKKPGTVCFRKK